jgi:hypothetical protein
VRHGFSAPKKAGPKPRPESVSRGLRGDRRPLGRLGRLFLDQRGAFAEAFAQVGEFGAAHGARALDFNFVHARRVQRENALDAFAVADAADGEGLVQPAPAPANDHAGKHLNALLVAFDDLGMHAHAVTDVEDGIVRPKLFGLNFVQ